MLAVPSRRRVAGLHVIETPRSLCGMYDVSSRLGGSVKTHSDTNRLSLFSLSCLSCPSLSLSLSRIQADRWTAAALQTGKWTARPPRSPGARPPRSRRRTRTRPVRRGRDGVTAGGSGARRCVACSTELCNTQVFTSYLSAALGRCARLAGR